MDNLKLFMEHIFVIIIFIAIFSALWVFTPVIRFKMTLRKWRKGLKPEEYVQFLGYYSGEPMQGVVKEVSKEDNRAIVFNPKSLYVCRVPIKKLYPCKPLKDGKRRIR